MNSKLQSKQVLATSWGPAGRKISFATPAEECCLHPPGLDLGDFAALTHKGLQPDPLSFSA